MAETEYKHRTDNVEDKMGMLARAYKNGQIDVALSLAESIKETLTFERHELAHQHQENSDETQVPAFSFGRVADLPDAWMQWAHGWAFYKTIVLSEEENIERTAEPIDIRLEFPVEQVADLRREIRVARVDEINGILRQVPSQVCHDSCDGKVRSCRLVVQADVTAASKAYYLIIYGNPDAELPNYTSDLTTDGEGFGLEITNNHFTAQLSKQNGQLQRLQYRRGFDHVAYGAQLELNTGGEGHGEPPGIDWAHDYVTSENYQKLRVTGWSSCPNYEVIQGPLCVQVRRWGFPRSGLHPVFTPSRLHMDLTYTFYAGLPYFLKESRMNSVAEFEINVIRDDQWLFYGMPFSDCIWIDRDGIVHEGEVPDSHANDQWGVGFFRRDSHDAFIALWLEHRSENCTSLNHSGAPSLSYYGRAQVWCRAAIHGKTQFHEGSELIQKNAYYASRYTEENGREVVQNLHRRLVNPLKISEGNLPDTAASAMGRLAREGESPSIDLDTDNSLKRAVWDALREVEDDQLMTINSNVVDMGYIYDLKVKDGTVQILLTMPHRGRPKYQFIGNPIRDRILQVDGVRECIIDFTWEPGWTSARLSKKGRRELGI